MNPDRHVDDPFLRNFRPHLLWLLLAVVVLGLAGLFVLSPWVDDDNDEGPIALPTPAVQSTPNP